MELCTICTRWPSLESSRREPCIDGWHPGRTDQQFFVDEVHIETCCTYSYCMLLMSLASRSARTVKVGRLNMGSPRGIQFRPGTDADFEGAAKVITLARADNPLDWACYTKCYTATGDCSSIEQQEELAKLVKERAASCGIAVINGHKRVSSWPARIATILVRTRRK